MTRSWPLRSRAGHFVDRRDEIYLLRGERHPTTHGKQSDYGMAVSISQPARIFRFSRSSGNSHRIHRCDQKVRQERERRGVLYGSSSGAESTIRHALPSNRRNIRAMPPATLRDTERPFIVIITVLGIPDTDLFGHTDCAALLV